MRIMDLEGMYIYICDFFKEGIEVIISKKNDGPN